MRILIVDDQLVVAEALAMALRDTYEIRGVLSDHRDVLAWLTRCEVDVVILDSTLPGCDLLELIRKIRHVQGSPRIIVMSMFEGGTDWPGIQRMGASGVVSKCVGLWAFAHSIDEILSQPIRDAGLAPTTKAPSLTSRQMDVIVEIARGEGRKQIAMALGLGQARVDELVAQLKQRAGAHDWADLVLRAIELGWIEPRVPPPGKSEIPRSTLTRPLKPVP